MKGIGSRASFLRAHGQQETLLHRDPSSLSSASEDQRRLSAVSHYSSHSGTLGADLAGSVCGSSRDSVGGAWSDGIQHTDYGSLLYQLREAEDESTDLVHFIRQCLEVFWDSLVVTALLVLLLAMPVAMLAVGSSYLHECPVEPRLPIYLQVGGAFGCLLLLLLLWQQRRWRRAKDLDDDDDDLDDGVMTRSCRFTSHVVCLFVLGWFVMGNVWLWGLGQPNFQQPLHEPLNWCHRHLYFFTLYHLLAVYVLLGLVLMSFTCTVLVYSVRRVCYGR